VSEIVKQLADQATREIHGDDYRIATRLIIEKAIKAALADRQWVPVDPTKKMMKAGDETGMLMCGDECSHDHSDHARTIYKVMLAAAPKKPS